MRLRKLIVAASGVEAAGSQERHGGLAMGPLCRLGRMEVAGMRQRHREK